MITTRWIVGLILGALIIVAVTRTFVTLQSEYFRWIDLPEYSFGIIGAGMSLAGWIVPFYVKPLTRRFSPSVNMLIAGGIGTAALFGVVWMRGAGGIVSAFIVMLTLIHVGFLMSRYINRDAPSEKRASILSVNNLVLNIGYSLFSGFVAVRLGQVDFGETMKMLPVALLGGVLIWFLAIHRGGKPANSVN